MAVLDTSCLIDFLRNKEGALELVKDIASHETVFITTPSIMELWEGALKSDIKENEMKKVEGLLLSASVLDFDSLSAKRAAEINVELSKTPLEIEDVMIASISLINGETVVSRDQHFTRIPGLRVLKY